MHARQPEAGDILRRPKGPLGVVDHVGVYRGYSQVVHNTPERGEHVSSYAEFAAGKPVRIRKTPAGKRGRVLRNAFKVNGAPRAYNLVFNNCEHTATRITEGNPHSKQLEFAVLCCVVAVGILAIAKAGR